MRFHITKAIDIETLADCFAGYCLQILVLPGGIILVSSDEPFDAKLIEAIEAEMKSVGATRIELAKI